MSKTFKDLNIWKKGLELLLIIYKITKSFPPDEKYALISDIRRSANSIIANIAESCGRYYFADKVRILYITRGEIEETRSHLAVSENLGYISNLQYEMLEKEYNGLGLAVNTYILSLKKLVSKKPQ